MDFMNVLSLAIGIVTVYLVFALAVTACNEAIAASLSSRGKWLFRGVASLLSETARSQGNYELAVKAYDSPYIAYLQRGWRYRPSYLPAWNILQGLLHASAADKSLALSSIDDFKRAVKDLPAQSPLRVGVENLLAGGQTSVDEFRRSFEVWFTTFESQVMAWYRQKTQLVVAWLSLAVVVAMNVDTLSLVNKLAADPKAREAIVRQAEKYVQTPPRGAVAAAPEAPAPAASGAQGASGASAPASAPLAEAPSLQAQRDHIRQLSSELAATGLQLGWTQSEWSRLTGQPEAAAAPPATREVVVLWLQKLVGLLLSAFAVSLGAPFWFDLLKGLVSIRAVGRNPVEQADQAQKKAGAGG